MPRILRLAVVLLTLSAAACATNEPVQVGEGPGWTAHGYLTPGETGDPEIIGTFDSEADCQSAVDDWMSRQVVGNPVSGECLPVDRR
ncbi:MAG: hypothetical protein A3E78_12960 [Alphaproteobacteria bacterium RIFCSPHIGHO2_12_FULL_63_12]|nr:MAG: hypothetical protein A3E78_12960 [Alphaproteobacteria bacterium RIFCSPHIGHO2_12_FULL_63_12]